MWRNLFWPHRLIDGQRTTEIQSGNSNQFSTDDWKLNSLAIESKNKLHVNSLQLKISELSNQHVNHLSEFRCLSNTQQLLWVWECEENMLFIIENYRQLLQKAATELKTDESIKVDFYRWRINDWLRNSRATTYFTVLLIIVCGRIRFSFQFRSNTSRFAN